VSIRSDLRQGSELDIPLCCRLRFSLEYALNHDAEQSLKRGIRLTRNGDPYVPCLLFHEAAVTHAEYEMLLNAGGTITAHALELDPS
jgi:hypothetical protein